MKTIQILTRELHIKNREGSESVSFPILKISLDEKNLAVLNSRIGGNFHLKIQAFELLPYQSEIPSTLYCDNPLVLTCSESNNITLESLN